MSDVDKKIKAEEDAMFDIFEADGWDGKSGLTNIDKKLENIGFDKIENLRQNGFEVSDRLYVMMISVIVIATILSGAVSVSIGYQSADGAMRFLQSGWYFCFQAILLFCGTILGCYAYGRVGKIRLAIMTAIVMIPVFVISVATGLAQQYQIQLDATGNPLMTLFTALAPDDPIGMQTTYNYLTTICFDLNLLFLPIIIMSMTCPKRESWELKKLAKTAIQKEDSKRDIIEIIAKSEASQVKHDANMAFIKNKAIADTNIKILQNRISTVNKVHKIAQSKDVERVKGLWGFSEVPIVKAASESMIKLVLGDNKKRPKPRMTATPIRRPIKKKKA